jgi:hypothetical protein
MADEFQFSQDDPNSTHRRGKVEPRVPFHYVAGFALLAVAAVGSIYLLTIKKGESPSTEPTAQANTELQKKQVAKAPPPKKPIAKEKEKKPIELTDYEKKMAFMLYHFNIARAQISAINRYHLRFPPLTAQDREDYRELSGQFKAFMHGEFAGYNRNTFRGWLEDGQLESIVTEGRRNGWDTFEKVSIYDDEIVVSVLDLLTAASFRRHADFIHKAEIFLKDKNGATLEKWPKIELPQ